MNIVLKQLNIFKLVAQEKSITAAAKKLFLTKPAVSMALNELEYTGISDVFEATDMATTKKVNFNSKQEMDIMMKTGKFSNFLVLIYRRVKKHTF